MGTEEAIVASNELQIKTNELQFAANKLQKEMIDVIATNNKETSKHNYWIRWLTGLIVLLTVITVLSNCNQTGRYAITTGNNDNTIWVVDTRNGKVWLRGAQTVVYMGTHKNPECTVMTE